MRPPTRRVKMSPDREKVTVIDDASAFLTEIRTFSDTCEDAEYTDTGEAWQIIDEAERVITALLDTINT